MSNELSSNNNTNSSDTPAISMEDWLKSVEAEMNSTNKNNTEEEQTKSMDVELGVVGSFEPIKITEPEEGMVTENGVVIEEITKAADEDLDNFNPFAINSGKPKRKKIIKTDDRFDPEILNIQGGYANLKKNIDAYITWCKNHPEEQEGFSFLFTGLPGTGKTQLGRHIAELLGRKLLVKKMSDISSCWVGETEKNIAAAFEEAAEKNHVLMIDEADSLFYNRQAARASWEISSTNEILSQMEEFPGVFICTTNLLNNFDSAAMRRFDWKVGFLPSTAEARIKLFKAYCLNGKDPTEGCINALRDADLNGLCPGDFKAVWRKFRFIDDKSEKDLLKALVIELRYKQK